MTDLASDVFPKLTISQFRMEGIAGFFFQLISIQKVQVWSPHHWETIMKPRRPSLPSHIDGISSVISCQRQIEGFLKISREPLGGACIGYRLDFKVVEYLTLHEETLVSKHLLIVGSPFFKPATIA